MATCRHGSRKVDTGQVHAAILAAAGSFVSTRGSASSSFSSRRSGFPQRARCDRGRNAPTMTSFARYCLPESRPTEVATRAERAFLAALEGGCQIRSGRSRRNEAAIPGAPRLVSDTADATRCGVRVFAWATPEASGIATCRRLANPRCVEFVDGAAKFAAAHPAAARVACPIHRFTRPDVSSHRTAAPARSRNDAFCRRSCTSGVCPKRQGRSAHHRINAGFSQTSPDELLRTYLRRRSRCRRSNPLRNSRHQGRTGNEGWSDYGAVQRAVRLLKKDCRRRCGHRRLHGEDTDPATAEF